MDVIEFHYCGVIVLPCAEETGLQQSLWGRSLLVGTVVCLIFMQSVLIFSPHLLFVKENRFKWQILESRKHLSESGDIVFSAVMALSFYLIKGEASIFPTRLIPALRGQKYLIDDYFLLVFWGSPVDSSLQHLAKMHFPELDVSDSIFLLGDSLSMRVERTVM